MTKKFSLKLFAKNSKLKKKKRKESQTEHLFNWENIQSKKSRNREIKKSGNYLFQKTSIKESRNPGHIFLKMHREAILPLLPQTVRHWLGLT